MKIITFFKYVLLAALLLIGLEVQAKGRFHAVNNTDLSQIRVIIPAFLFVNCWDQVVNQNDWEPYFPDEYCEGPVDVTVFSDNHTDGAHLICERDGVHLYQPHNAIYTMIVSGSGGSYSCNFQ